MVEVRVVVILEFNPSPSLPLIRRDSYLPPEVRAQLCFGGADVRIFAEICRGRSGLWYLSGYGSHFILRLSDGPVLFDYLLRELSHHCGTGRRQQCARMA